jgi:hypothetical protein
MTSGVVYAWAKRIAPPGLPTRLPSPGIERGDIRLRTVAVDVDDQQVAIERGRSAVAVLRLVAEPRAPQYLARDRERGGAVGAEVDVDAIAARMGVGDARLFFELM